WRFPDPQAQRIAAVQSARIPRARLTHLVEHARPLLQRLDQTDVPAEHREALGETRRTWIGTAARDLAQPREQPRIADCAPPDHHGIATGLLAQSHIALDIGDITVADDRNVSRQRVAHLPDDVWIALA